MNPSGFCSGDVSGLTVEEQVGQRRPNERSADSGHLREFLLTQSHPVNQDQFANKQVVLNQDVEFGSTAFINTFSDVNEPRIKFAARVAVFDVVALVEIKESTFARWRTGPDKSDEQL